MNALVVLQCFWHCRDQWEFTHAYRGHTGLWQGPGASHPPPETSLCLQIAPLVNQVRVQFKTRGGSRSANRAICSHEEVCRGGYKPPPPISNQCEPLGMCKCSLVLVVLRSLWFHYSPFSAHANTASQSLNRPLRTTGMENRIIFPASSHVIKERCRRLERLLSVKHFFLGGGSDGSCHLTEFGACFSLSCLTGDQHCQGWQGKTTWWYCLHKSWI